MSSESSPSNVDLKDHTSTPDQRRHKTALGKEHVNVNPSGSPVHDCGVTDTEQADITNECRICLFSEPVDELMTPCHCMGTVAHAHLSCLQKWCAEKRSLVCELCGRRYSDTCRDQLASAISAPRHTVVVVVQPTVTVSNRPPPVNWLLVGFHATLLVSLLVGVLYLGIIISMKGSDEFWVVFVWRFLTVLIPIYLVGRLAHAVKILPHCIQMWRSGQSSS